MSKGVSKHCSILNYLRRTDEDLHELLQDLCIGKMLIPRKGSPGITFLRPDKDLLKKIQAMAAGDDPEEAIAVLQSLVLLDNIASVSDFDAKKSDIPTYLRKKLAIASVDGKKVVLQNGAEIVPDKDFESRKDRGNISVYMISKELVPKDGVDADFSNAKLKAKKGGAELSESRSQLFESVLAAFCDNKRGGDPAMELLVALYGWASDNQPALAGVIAAKASGDSLATLAVVLQPYKTGAPDYLLPETLSNFRKDMYGSDVSDAHTFSTLPAFTMNKNAKEVYENLCTDAAGKFGKIAGVLKDKSAEISQNCAKLNIVTLLRDMYQTTFVADACTGMGCPRPANSVLFAEAELRVMSAMVLENSNGDYDQHELLALYRSCRLDQPYMCADKELVQGSNLGFYYSTVYLIVRSDALLHVPSTNGELTDQVANDNVFISLNKSVGKLLESKRAHSARMLSVYDRKW